MSEILSITQTAQEAVDQADSHILEKLQPTYDSLTRVHDAIVSILGAEGVEEDEIVNYLYNPEYQVMTPGRAISVFGRDRIRLAHQYEHVRKVVGATLQFKRILYEMDMPERIVAYQTGTGWPVPRTTSRCRKVGFAHYGDGILQEFSPPGSRSKPDSGIHIYRLTGDGGQQYTLLALKDRMHGYTETGWETASHDLAFMPRFLKGIGTEFILSTFASGVDPSGFEKGFVRKQDLAVIVGGTDSSRLTAAYGVGSGDQRILGPVFGGPFQNIAAMGPDARAVSLFQSAVASVNEMEITAHHHPWVFPTFEVDTSRTPNFQDRWAQAEPHTTVADMQKLDAIPKDLRVLFPHMPITLVHGMVQFIEREGYFQSSPYGVQTPFNRRLPELPVVIFTDLVDTGEHGQSAEISDAAVRAEGKIAEEVNAAIITSFFEQYASLA